MLYKLLIDFGLVILIWLTQLVVYPSFSYYQPGDLVRWHTKYTTAVSIVVMPLMLGQVAVHSYGLLQEFSWIRLSACLLILLAWINTFFFAVPIHNKIGMGQEVIESAKELVGINWYRTGLWSLVFLISCYDLLRS